VNRRILVSVAVPVLCGTAGAAAAQDREPVEGWTRFLQLPGSVHEVDTLAFLRTASGPYRFAHRFTLDQPLADSAGEFDRIETISEYDCTGGRYRDQRVRLNLGERLLRQVPLPYDWAEPDSSFREVFDRTCSFLVTLGERLPPRRDAYSLRFVEEMPELINRNEVGSSIARAYPPGRRNAGDPGFAEIGIKILPDGRVDTAYVREASAPEFGQAAMRVVSRMRFRPAKVGGRAVATWVTLPMTFSITGQ
jgi:TonB family protein